MQKRGFTTFQAIEYIAQYFNIEEKEIQYCGLKDEDAITTQTISISCSYLHVLDGLARFNGCFVGDENYIEVKFMGYSNTDLNIGDLEGNIFTLTVRNLHADKAAELIKMKKQRLYVPNYFDKQRFGVKGKSKNTHKIGQYVLEKDFKRALEEVIAVQLPETEQALQFHNAPESFFNSLDKRKLSFYKNSYASLLFNNDLKNIINSNLHSVSVTDESIEFIMPQNAHDLIKIVDKNPLISRISYVVKDDEIVEKNSKRHTVINTLIRFQEVFDDIYYPGKQAIRLSFFLESGCYATMVMKQLFV